MANVVDRKKWTDQEMEAYRAELVASWAPPTPEVMAEVNRILGAIPLVGASTEAAETVIAA